MTTAELVGVEAESRGTPGRGWNWGLMVAVGLCVAFWSAVMLGIAAVL